jgi:hypothetical protein
LCESECKLILLIKRVCSTAVDQLTHFTRRSYPRHMVFDNATLFLKHAIVASGTINTKIVDDAINSSVYSVVGFL